MTRVCLGWQVLIDGRSEEGELRELVNATFEQASALLGGSPDKTCAANVAARKQRLADAAQGGVLDALDDLNLTASTLVVLHSDHGWHLGEAAQWEKRTNWELATRVPLIVRVPWFGSGAGGGTMGGGMSGGMGGGATRWPLHPLRDTIRRRWRSSMLPASQAIGNSWVELGRSAESLAPPRAETRIKWLGLAYTGNQLVMVMVIYLGLYRSLPRYLDGSSGPVRRERRRASNIGKEEPSLARPPFVVLHAITV